MVCLPDRFSSLNIFAQLLHILVAIVLFCVLETVLFPIMFTLRVCVYVVNNHILRCEVQIKPERGYVDTVRNCAPGGPEAVRAAERFEMANLANQGRGEDAV